MASRYYPSRFFPPNHIFALPNLTLTLTATAEVSSSIHTTAASISGQHTPQELRILHQLSSLLSIPLKPPAVAFSPEKSPAAVAPPHNTPAAVNRPEKVNTAVTSALDPVPLTSPENITAAVMLPENIPATRGLDSFLSVEDKLRGVFLQKLPGRSAVEQALTAVGADLTLKIISDVLSRGNLSGESMVTFFEWAICQPSISFPQIDGYHVVLKALAKRKYISFVHTILHLMHVRKINPNLQTFSISINALLRANRVSMALHLTKTAHNFGIFTNTDILNAALRCFCRHSHLGAATTLMGSFNTFSNIETFHILLSGWSKLGRVNPVLETITEMTQSGFEPDPSAFGYLIEALGRSGRIQTALDLFHHMEAEGMSLDTTIYNSVILNFVSAGDVASGLSYFKRMTDRGYDPDSETYTILIKGMVRVRRVADALELLEEMMGRGLVPPSGAIASFIYKLCQYGPPDAAVVVYRVGRQAGCRISSCAYKKLLMRLSKFGKCNTMLRVWDYMRDDGIPSDAEVYAHLVIGLCNIGRLDAAVLVVEESIRLGVCPKWTVRGKLNSKLMDAGKFDVAYKLLLKVRSARRDEKMRRDWRAKGWHF